MASWHPPSENIISKGRQPQVSVDNAGSIRIAFGRNDSIFCATSLDKGNTFAKAVLVGVVPKMHLGMARGPQLASSANFSIITAIDKNGDIHYFTLKHAKGESWKTSGFVNDVRLSAPEGLMNLAADKQDNFYATWLDLREGKSNNIYFSSLNVTTGKWNKNALAYKSPDGHVCECCRPSIAVQGSNIAIMFRNWLNGSRDLYEITSSNKGESFKQAVKLGNGTWRLNACPMDGGSLNFNADNTINTTWQRQGIVYYCKSGENEKELSKGRDCSITASKGQVIVSMSDAGVLKYKNVETNQETIVGKGSYLKTVILPDNRVLCIWEEGNMIKTKNI
ncbi:MAG TPA: hypothetical protein VGN20_11375 [Mucilaginibacter sp.]